MPHSGSCLCGQIQFTIDGPLRPVVTCHCQQCRKSSGHHVAATSCAQSNIEVKGEVTWYQSSETARRGFCGICGSQLFWDGPGADLSIFAGALDGKTGLTTAGHIFCADKGDYYDLEDGLPQAEQDDLDMGTR